LVNGVTLPVKFNFIISLKLKIDVV
jgi:hypothetical protein